MPKVHRSPLSETDLDALAAMSAKANAHGARSGYVPLYVAIDIGDASHRDAFLFVTWPALDSPAARCARLIFDSIARVVMEEFGAHMVPTSPEEAADASHG